MIHFSRVKDDQLLDTSSNAAFAQTFEAFFISYLAAQRMSYGDLFGEQGLGSGHVAVYNFTRKVS